MRLRASGEHRRAQAPEARDDLTPQERQIATLAGEGRTNREIGAALPQPAHHRDAPRTGLPKLGISDRGALPIPIRRVLRLHYMPGTGGDGPPRGPCRGRCGYTLALVEQDAAGQRPSAAPRPQPVGTGADPRGRRSRPDGVRGHHAAPRRSLPGSRTRRACRNAGPLRALWVALIPLVRCSGHLHYHWYAPERFTTAPEGAAAVRACASATLRRHVEWIDAELATRPWLVGGERTAADIYLHMLTHWAQSPRDSPNLRAHYAPSPGVHGVEGGRNVWVDLDLAQPGREPLGVGWPAHERAGRIPQESVEPGNGRRRHRRLSPHRRRNPAQARAGCRRTRPTWKHSRLGSLLGPVDERASSRRATRRRWRRGRSRSAMSAQRRAAWLPRDLDQHGVEVTIDLHPGIERCDHRRGGCTCGNRGRELPERRFGGHEHSRDSARGSQHDERPRALVAYFNRSFGNAGGHGASPLVRVRPALWRSRPGSWADARGGGRRLASG